MNHSEVVSLVRLGLEQGEESEFCSHAVLTFTVVS